MNARPLALLMVALIWACADDAVPIADGGCLDQSDCATDQLCVDQLCVPVADSEPPPPVVDAAPPIDAGPDAAPVRGGLGDPCDTADDCLGGPCIEASAEGRRICTGPCDPNDPDTCPDDLVCAAVTNAGPDRTFLCFPAADFLCRPCEADTDCGGLGDRCLDRLDGRFCGRACDLIACPEGYGCEESAEGEPPQCHPASDVCSGCFDPDGDGYGVGAECAGADCRPDDGMAFPSADEVCNGTDDDCDDAIDEGFDLASDPENCGECGTACAFEGAVAGCTDSACTLIECQPDRYDLDRRLDNGCEYFCEGEPDAPELCDGVDDDCDGSVDEGDPGAGIDCDTGELGRCGLGATACDGGQTICVRRFDPLAETCDGVDEDCDGDIDETNPGAGLPCETDRPGICTDGLTACQAGGVVCVSRQDAIAEACNGIDDDCDGDIDEGCPSALTVGGDRNLTAFGGGGGGAFRLVCGAGQLAVGVDVRHAAEVDQVRVICQAVSLAVDRGAAPFAYGSGAQGGQVRTGTAGGGGGGQSTLLCPAGSFLHALQVRSAARVDQTSFTCARIDLTGYPIAPVVRRTDTNAATYGGNGGAARALQRCTDGEFISGLFGRAGGRVDQLGPVCRRYAIDVQ